MIKAPEIHFPEWQAAALAGISVVVVLISSSPTTAVYSMADVAGLWLLGNVVFVFASIARKQIGLLRLHRLRRGQSVTRK
jgi:hypothetical protein